MLYGYIRNRSSGGFGVINRLATSGLVPLPSNVVIKLRNKASSLTHIIVDIKGNSSASAAVLQNPQLLFIFTVFYTFEYILS